MNTSGVSNLLTFLADPHPVRFTLRRETPETLTNSSPAPELLQKIVTRLAPPSPMIESPLKSTKLTDFVRFIRKPRRCDAAPSP